MFDGFNFQGIWCLMEGKVSEIEQASWSFKCLNNIYVENKNYQDVEDFQYRKFHNLMSWLDSYCYYATFLWIKYSSCWLFSGIFYFSKLFSFCLHFRYVGLICWQAFLFVYERSLFNQRYSLVLQCLNSMLLVVLYVMWKVSTYTWYAVLFQEAVLGYTVASKSSTVLIKVQIFSC